MIRNLQVIGVHVCTRPLHTHTHTHTETHPHVRTQRNKYTQRSTRQGANQPVHRESSPLPADTLPPHTKNAHTSSTHVSERTQPRCMAMLLLLSKTPTLKCTLVSWCEGAEGHHRSQGGHSHTSLSLSLPLSQPAAHTATHQISQHHD